MIVSMMSFGNIVQANARDGATLGYVDNHGRGVAILAALTYGATLAGLDQAYTQRSFLTAASTGHQLVAYDRRGFGSSMAAGAPASWQQLGDDLWSIADAAGIERAVLYGVFDSGYIIAEAARQRPERVLGLIFNRVPPVFAPKPDYPYGLPADVVAACFGDSSSSDRTGRANILRAIGIGEPDATALLSTWRGSTTPETLDRMHGLMREADLRPLAALLRFHALVLEPHRRSIVSGWGQALANLLPDARLARPERAGEALGAMQGFLSVIEIEAGQFASHLSRLTSSAVEEAQRSVASLRRILVPVNSTADSERAAEMACRIGEAQLAEIVLVHVVEVPFTRPLANVTVEERERGLEVLRVGEAIADRHRMRSRTRLMSERSAAVGIIRAATEEQADVIVMALDEKRSRDAAEAGETPDEIMRRAPCEVLVVRAPQRAGPRA